MKKPHTYGPSPIKTILEEDCVTHPWLGKQVELVDLKKKIINSPGELYRVHKTGSQFRCFIRPFYDDDDGFAIYTIDSLDQILLFGVDRIEYVLEQITKIE